MSAEPTDKTYGSVLAQRALMPLTEPEKLYQRACAARFWRERSGGSFGFAKKLKNSGFFKIFLDTARTACYIIKAREFKSAYYAMKREIARESEVTSVEYVRYPGNTRDM